MPVKVQDFSDFEEQNTLEIRVPVYKNGEPTGDIEKWMIPPVKMETEIAIRTAQTQQMKELTKSLQAAQESDGETIELDPENDVRCMGDYWAPMVALYVRTPQFDPEELKRNYPGALLRMVGQVAQNFFLFGSLPETQETTPEQEPEPTSLPKGKKSK